MNNELIEKIKAAKSAEEIIEIARKELSFEDTANVAGGTGRFELSEAQAEHVAGGLHKYTDSTGSSIWVHLMDIDYVLGTDPLYDKAYVLEGMAFAGFRVDDIIDAACSIFEGAAKIDVAAALRSGGTVYLADCYRSAHGFHFSPGN